MAPKTLIRGPPIDIANLKTYQKSIYTVIENFSVKIPPYPSSTYIITS